MAEMTDIGKPERATQNRVVQLFCNELGYHYLGDWTDRAGKSILMELLTKWILEQRAGARRPVCRPTGDGARSAAGDGQAAGYFQGGIRL